MRGAHRNMIRQRQWDFVATAPFPPDAPTATPGDWHPTSAFDALGAFADTSESSWTAYKTFVGRTPRYRRQFTRAANSVVGDSSFSTTRNAFNNLLSTSKFPGNDSTLTHNFTMPMLYGSQTLLDNLVPPGGTSYTNQAHWEAVGDLIAQWGYDELLADGRPKLVLCIGWEANASNTNYIWKFASPHGDYTLPDRFSAGYDQIITTIRSRLDAGKRENVKFAYGVQIRPGANGYGRTEHLVRGCPTLVDEIEVDIYDSYALQGDLSAGYGSGMTQAQRIEQFNKPFGTWYRKVNDDQGLDACKQIAIDNNIHMSFGEWGVHHKIAGSSNPGGDDNPDFIVRMYEYMNNLAAINRLGPACYFESNANPNDSHKLNGSEFPNARNKFLELFGV